MIEVLSHRCQPYLYKRAHCRICVDTCPEGCIDFKDSIPSIDDNKCTLCGICTGACPSGALRVEGFNDGELWQKLEELTKGKESIVFTCSSEERKGIRLKKGTCLIKLPCIGILKESHLSGLFFPKEKVATSEGGVKKVWLRSSCKDCTSDQGRRVVSQTIGYAINILKLFGLEGEIILSEEFPVAEKGKKVKAMEILPAPHYSRREFLSTFRDKAVALRPTDIEVDDEDEIQYLPDEDLPERRRLLFEFMADLKGIEKTIFEKGFLPLRQLEIDDKCTLCTICDLFCPTGAIDRIEDEKKVRIDFRVACCTGCYQCEELCPEDAMKSTDRIDLKPFLERKRRILYQRQKVSCPRCSKPYLPKEGMDCCLSCRKSMDVDRAFLRMMGLGD